MPTLLLASMIDTDARAFAITGTTDLVAWDLEGVIVERAGRYFLDERELSDGEELLGPHTDLRMVVATFYRDDDRDLALARERYRRLTYDPLTGLFVRRFLVSHIHRIPRPAIAMAIDLDRFRRLNDLYGLPAGDHALRRVAMLLRAQLREGDIAVRTSGQQFIAIGPALDRARAEALRVACRQPYLFKYSHGTEPTQHVLTLSIALFPLPATFDELLAETEVRMTIAKRTRDCVVA